MLLLKARALFIMYEFIFKADMITKYTCVFPKGYYSARIVNYGKCIFIALLYVTSTFSPFPVCFEYVHIKLIRMATKV